MILHEVDLLQGVRICQLVFLFFFFFFFFFFLVQCEKHVHDALVVSLS